MLILMKKRMMLHSSRPGAMLSVRMVTKILSALTDNAVIIKLNSTVSSAGTIATIKADLHAMTNVIHDNASPKMLMTAKIFGKDCEARTIF